MPTPDKARTYLSYLKVDELLSLQQPQSDGPDGPEHDELLFIIIHQTYELWFKQIIHELGALQTALEGGDTHRSLALLGRIRTIMKTCVAQVDILETMTPLQFNSFRGRLQSSSGFQSAASSTTSSRASSARSRRVSVGAMRLGLGLQPGRACARRSTSSRVRRHVLESRRL